MSIEQLRQLFALESQDTLQQIEDSLLQLESKPDDPEAIKLLFRAFHTIKGSAGVVGLDEVSEFTHVIENLLDKVRNGQMRVTSDFVRLLLSCRDYLAKSLDNVSDEVEDSQALSQTKIELLGQLQTYQNPAKVPAKSTLSPSAPVAPVAPNAPNAASTPESPDHVPQNTTHESPSAQSDHTEATQSAPTPSASPSLPTRSKATIPPISGIKPDRLFQVFKEESRETLNRMLQASEQLRSGQEPQDAYMTLQSATQTLHGAANLVGLKKIATYALQLGNQLQRSVGSALAGDEDFAQLMRDFSQHIGVLLDHAYQNPPGSAQFDELLPQLQATGNLLLQQLRAVMEQRTNLPASSTASAHIPAHHATPVEVLNEQIVEDSNWHISLRFSPDAMSNGVDPLANIRYLAEHGKIVRLITLCDAIPQADDMDPESCYLGFEIAFNSDADKTAIESLFDLVRDFCAVRIVPPHSDLSQYIALIRELPEDTQRLGEILIETGALTKRELHDALGQSSASSAQDSFAENNIQSIEVKVEKSDQSRSELPQETRPQPMDLRQKTRKMLHVDAGKLDQLIDLVGELVIANAGINLLAQESMDGRLKESASLMSRLVEDIRNSTLSMRMVQIGNTFTRFRRLVHDLSHDLGKQIDLVINGSETELDKSMVEKINDPLMHLVRNAIDHGIEPEQQRIASGKPASGTLQLNAYHDSGSIVIEVSDDGRGLNRQAILASARAKGLIKSDQELNTQEIDNLIFEPNLSTAKTVTQLSGRGVGLDVVKRNINALNGTIDVKSREGEGVTIQIYLPLTLAIIDGFLLSVGNSRFVVPLDRVVECVEFSNNIHSQECGYINLRGRVLPLLYLNHLFQLRQEHSDQRQNIIVVHYGSQQAGLVVDALLGELQAVIKPLGKIFEKLSGISGATILGSGEVALILDVPELVKRYAGKHHQAKQPVTKPQHLLA